MKTAETWITDEVKGFDFRFVDNVEPEERTFVANENFKKLIEQIQLDAWKQGMTDAEKIVYENVQPCLDILRKRDGWRLD